MKKTIKISAVFIGLVIGAGFASGREILEYFNFHSNGSIYGVLLAVFLFCAIIHIILSKASLNGICDYDSYINSVAGKLAPAVKIFMLIYMFCSLFVMFSGSGALIYSLTPFSEVVGSLIMALICFIVLSFDLKGIVALNVILVPLMICGIVYVSVCTALFGNVSTFLSGDYITKDMALSAICYCTYNTITAGAVLVPLARGLSTKDIRRSSIIGGFILGILITLIFTVQEMNFDAVKDSELPMLELAAFCGKMCKKIYSAVLFMAICTTAVSSGFGLMSHFANKINTLRQRVFFAAVICLAALPPAMYGFSNLVLHLYSFFGYMGMIWMIWIVIDRYS